MPGPGYFVVDAEPGSTVSQYALVSNTGAAAVEAQVVPVDAVTSDTGGIAYRLPSDPRQLVGGWVSLAASRFQVEPGKGVVTPFTISVPAGTPPGQYVGGLTAFVPVGATQQSQPQQGQAGQQFAVVVQTRSVAAVEVNVPGLRRAAFTIFGADGTYQPDSAYVVIRVRNTGNVLLQGHGNVVVTRAADSTPIIAGPFTVDTTVPDSDFTYPIRWTRQPDLGRYRMHVELAPTPKPGTQPILLATPNAAPRAGTPGGAVTPGTSLLTAVLALLGVVIVVLLTIIALQLRRRGAHTGGMAG